MALDPNIALGVRPIEIANPLAQYGQIAQLQAAQNQNQLAQYQLGAAQRADVAAEGLNKLYAKHYDPVKGTINQNALMAEAAATPGLASQIPKLQELAVKREQETAALSETKSKTGERDYKQRIDKATKAISDIAALNSPQEAIASIDQHLAKGDIDQQKADMLKSQLAQAPSFGAWQKGMLVNILDAKERLTMTAPKPVQVKRADGSIIFLDENPNSPTFQKEVMPAQASGMTPYEKARLAFDQNKFAWEKANPGYELKEDADGNMFGINKRTLAAVPVTVGGGAPAVAPAVQGAGMPGPRVAQPGVVQAIPGMTSVLDQAAPAAAPAVAPVAGGPRQLVGKAKEAPAKFHDIDMQLSGLAGSLKAFKDEIKNEPITGAPLLPKGADTARMQAKYTSLLMGLKDLYTLGALTGPDMSIIESQINNPASWSGKLASYKGIKEQTQVIEDMLQRSTQNLENTYGRKPNATLKAMEPLKNVPGGSDSDPLGLLGVKR